MKLAKYSYLLIHSICYLFPMRPGFASQTPNVLQSEIGYEEFRKKFNLGGASTEQENKITMRLSQIFQGNPIEGLRLLNEVDQSIIPGLRKFQSTYLEPLSIQIKNSFLKGGRIFILDSGSSGRVAIDLAAKWQQFTGSETTPFKEFNGSVIGIIAGGARAFVRAKEGFEDSEKAGKTALYKYQVSPNDTVILVSASGSATFNCGAGIAAREAGAQVYYFFNSTTVPERTQELFDSYKVHPLLIDTGPQAISGSTRLQAASLAELALGGTLNDIASNFLGNSTETFEDLISNLEKGNQQISQYLENIVRFIQIEAGVFSSPQANFHKVKD